MEQAELKKLAMKYALLEKQDLTENGVTMGDLDFLCSFYNYLSIAEAVNNIWLSKQPIK